MLLAVLEERGEDKGVAEGTRVGKGSLAGGGLQEKETARAEIRPWGLGDAFSRSPSARKNEGGRDPSPWRTRKK